MKTKIKSLFVPVAAVGASLVPAVTAFAAETPVDVTAMVTTAATSVQGDMMATIAAVTPIAMVVVGAVMAIKFGIRFFRSIAK